LFCQRLGVCLGALELVSRRKGGGRRRLALLLSFPFTLLSCETLADDRIQFFLAEGLGRNVFRRLDFGNRRGRDLQFRRGFNPRWALFF
jgi:hypothetical protein